MIRKTRQRTVIESVFLEEERPLTPQEIYEIGKAKLPQLGLRTVYRQLQDLTNEGLVVGMDYPGQPIRYEWVKNEFHSHFICRSCQRVLDFPVEFEDVVIKPPKGFKVTGQETLFFGRCPDCR